MWRVELGDCVELMAGMPAGSIDAIVTDPPYGLEFMGKEWDRPWAVNARQSVGFEGREDNLTLPAHRDGRNANCRSCGGRARGANRCGCAVPAWDRAPAQDMRDFQAWCEAWATEALRVLKPGGHLLAFGGSRTYHRLACAIEDAGFEVRDCLAWMYGSGFPKSRNLDGEWAGWGTALKPAHEPIVLGRKPLVGTVAANVATHGTGAVNVAGCRIAHADEADLQASLSKNPGRDDLVTSGTYGAGRPQQRVNVEGRWPANVLLDEEAAAMLDGQTGTLAPGNHPAKRSGDRQEGVYALGHVGTEGDRRPTEAGGASRFFYCAKAGQAERSAGLDDRNPHPTVKPIAVMRWLCRLVTPPGGVVLDPFCGSGTTGIAAALEGFEFVGCERDSGYADVARARIAHHAALPQQLGLGA